MMNYDENIRIETKRDYLVVKSNELIQKSRFALSLSEQKTIAYICSMIKPIDETKPEQPDNYQLDYEFNIREYCKICGIDYDNGKNYINVKSVLQKLSDRSMWVKIGNEEVLCRWLAKVRLNKRKGIAYIRIDEDLAPFLFGLGQSFTQYQLHNILTMRSAFSIRIYELMKSYAFQKTKEFDIDELKKLLYVDDVKSYANFKDFRKYVLEVAQHEINELTDLTISFEPIKQGKKVVKVKFTIRAKKQNERMIAMLAVHEQLNKDI